MGRALILAIILLFPQVSLAAGIGANPKSLEVTGDTQETITVFNTGESIATYSVSPDEFEQLIKVKPEEILLEPEQAAQFHVTFNKLPSGSREVQLSVLAEEENSDIKTGIKVPVYLKVGGNEQTRDLFWPGLVAAILILAAIGILAYKKKHLLWFLTSLVAIVVSGLFFISVTTPNEYNQPSTNQAVGEFSVRLLQNEYEIDGEHTPFSALQLIAKQDNLILQYDPPNEMGVFVTQIGDNKNGTDGKYWVYEVNGKKIPIAADKYKLQAGDVLEWKFAIPE